MPSQIPPAHPPLSAQSARLAAKLIGATAHYVTAELDAGVQWGGIWMTGSSCTGTRR
jgi:folate-dependent phosphoribosylglycinamide formyltransferase PurN